MSSADILALLPMIVLAAGAVLIMMVIAARRSHLTTALLTLLSLLIAFVTIHIALRVSPRPVTPLMIVDRFALFYIGLVLLAGFAITLLAYDYLKARTARPEEFYILLLLTVLGGAVLTASRHFASFFLGLEVLSVSLYGLIGYRRNSMLGIEAAVKYLVLAGSSSAFLLFGMALVYLELGTMDFTQITNRTTTGGLSSVLLVTGYGMIVVSVGFKLALVPFHLWTPDVYEGSPAPVSALIASVSKGAMFVLLLRYFRPLNLQGGNVLPAVFMYLSIASMFVGNLLALRQNNVKRILAYSSIAHMGYLLLPFLADGSMAITAATYYLVAYFVMIIGSFGVVTVLSGKERDADGLQHYTALAWRRPWLAGIFTVMLFSLAGLPLTAGFVAKFYLLAAGVQSSLWVMVIILVVNSAIGLYYYLRIIQVIYTAKPSERPAATFSHPLAYGLTLSVLTVLLILLGIYPGVILNIIENIIPIT
jgi:NADH-quinone oxidoreductase subunit N